MRRLTSLALAICTTAGSAWAQPPAPTVDKPAPSSEAASSGFTPSGPLRVALKAELKRAVEDLSLPKLPKAYFAESTLIDSETIGVSAQLGAITASNHRRTSILEADMRVGDYDFDNSGFAGNFGGAPRAQVAIDSDALELRRSAWLLLDAAFKSATAAYEGKRAARQGRAAAGEDTPVPSFAKAPVVQAVDDRNLPLGDEQQYIALARAVSKAFREFPFIQSSGVIVGATSSRRIFLSTEGTEIVQPDRQVTVMAWATTQAADGMVLGHHMIELGRQLSDLPSEARLIDSIRSLAQTLEALAKAPVVENYSGPIVVEGAASAQLVERLLARQLTGTPPPEMPGGFTPPSNPMVSRLGLRILPAGFSLVDDPGLEQFAGRQMFGGYRFDDEGVKAERVTLVDNGTLRQLLTSRTPSKEFPTSNGHGRAWHGTAVGQPSNLVLSSTRGVNRPELKQALLREVKKEQLSHGFIVRLMEEPLTAILAGASGAGQTMPRGIGALAAPLLLYRVLPNGKEELVRGATLDGLQTQDLRDVMAASKQLTVHHSQMTSLPGALGQGGVGTLSLAVPDLLIRKIDVRRPTAPHPKPPVMPPPR